MRNYNELLTAISTQMEEASQQKTGHNPTPKPSRQENSSTILNQIELEIQRQGGYGC